MLVPRLIVTRSTMDHKNGLNHRVRLINKGTFLPLVVAEVIPDYTCKSYVASYL